MSSAQWGVNEEEKLNLAKLFGIQNSSVWRLGNIPDHEDDGDKKVYMNIMDIFRNLSQ